MVKRNKNIAQLSTNYLFPEINKRKKQYLAKHPEADLISLGIGNTTLPIPQYVLESLKQAASDLGTAETYTGYGPEQGEELLRSKIAETIYKHHISTEEIFISDGCKCDLGRLQMMLGPDVTIAVQDPAYPAYVDTGVIVGQTHQSPISYMPCTPDNHFFPNLNSLPKRDIIYITSPNNPTGTALDRTQLQQLVSYAKKNRSFIVYDAAYSLFIQDDTFPKSIYEIPDAKEVAIELNSFSKIIGFTGVRLGWSVVPKELKFEDGASVHADWNRMTSTFFNGASNIAQKGGIAVLDPEGLKEVKKMTTHYLENAQIIKSKLDSLGIQSFGGIHAPYLWAYYPGIKSWETFDKLLNTSQIIATPGSGFGPSGEYFMRFSAFGLRKDIEKAMQRL